MLPKLVRSDTKSGNGSSTPSMAILGGGYAATVCLLRHVRSPRPFATQCSSSFDGGQLLLQHVFPRETYLAPLIAWRRRGRPPLSCPPALHPIAWQL
eukprot:scaffold1355_cov268-Pinguiococcus_pyrenoidosus.AAC.89